MVGSARTRRPIGARVARPDDPSACAACASPPAARVVHDGDWWRVVHESDPVVVPGKLYVTLQRHAESLADLTPEESASLGPLLARVVAAVEQHTDAARVHVGSYGEQVRHVHFHVTPRGPRLPRGNAPAAIAQDVLGLLVRLRLRRPARPADVDALVGRLASSIAGDPSPVPRRTRFAVVPAVHLLLVRDGQVLLARRANTGYEDGKWSVPAGHLDGDEAVRTAAAREALEEVGVRIALDELDFAHVMHRRNPGEERVDFFVVARSWSGEPTIAEPDKCSELTWVDPAHLPDDVVPYVAAGITAAFSGRPYSEFGW